MRTYNVMIQEILQTSVEVEAASEYEAEQMVKDKYYDEDLVLDSSDFSHVNFIVEVENDVVMSLEEIRDELYTKGDQYDRVMLSSLMTTIGYINCQLELGYEPTDKEMKCYMDFLNNL